MNRLPPLLAGGRRLRILLVAALALGQATAAGIAAFSTRDVFAAFRASSEVFPLQPLLLIAGAGCAIALLRVAERVVAERLGQDYALALRIKLFEHLTRMSSKDVAQRRIGALSMRFVGDLAAVRNWVSRGIGRLISAGIVLPAGGAILYLLNPTLAYAAAIPVGVGLLLMALAGLPLGRMHRRLRARRARLAADMSERIPHAPELRLLGRMDIERDHLQRRSEKLIESSVARTRVAELLRAIPDAVAGFTAASILLVALTRGMAPAEAAAGLAAVGLMLQPMRDLAGVWDRRRAWVAARDKCEALLARPRLRRKPRTVSREDLAGPHALRFSKVSAGVLEDFTATAAAGEKIAIVGGNGSGKSTLLQLAAGLEDCNKGKVRLGDWLLSNLSASARRRAISLVSSRAPILAGSLRRALTMGLGARPDDAEILGTAETFGLAGVIERIGGLGGTLAEGGRNLSIGEARRVVLARAALSKAGLLLLDEPESGLDGGGEAQVADLLRNSGATVLVATHSRSVAAQMDRIWYLEGGRLIESGKPEELMRSDRPTGRFFRGLRSGGADAPLALAG
ncbi:ATP-binding cassette domain-containing protein [Algihabitans albus]|uniref:ATP-binding cassette domain-containing protein n=1 Tax=Algihabitans albus TaxID=2164067 RepID=UPI000E5C7632|nr:ATP-binding cassette domain-containing protein [Algihabitans albus]